MFCETHEVTITTDDDGAGVGYTPAVTGRVLAVRYVKPASGGFVYGVDFTLSSEKTGATIWTESDVDASATRCPRQPTHTTAGAAALYAADGQPVLEYCYVALDRVKIEVAAGGAARRGTFYVTIG